MNKYNRKSYFAPIADIVVLDGNDDLLDADTGIEIQSKKEGSSDDEAGAKGQVFDGDSFQSDIWDKD